MRDSNEDMIELIDTSNLDGAYSSTIRCKIADEELTLRFGIEPIDYGYLKRILGFRPFENTGVASYRYFFALSYRKDEDNENLGRIVVRVEQLSRHKQYEFTTTRKYIASILWFSLLTDKKQVEQMIKR